MDLENDREGRPFSPTGASPMIPAATEEDLTYIVGKKQASKIVEKRKGNMGAAGQGEDEPTVIGVRRDFNAGIQQRDLPDVTAELTQIAGKQQ